MSAPSHSATHHRINVISRGRGHSAVAKAAYCARSKIYDQRTEKWHDYTRKKGAAVSVEMIGWTGDAASLWNAAEEAERNKDGSYRAAAITARETVLALPADLPPETRARLVRGYALHLRDRYGVAVMTAIHPPDPGGDQRNHHVHLVETDRRVSDDGRFGPKVRKMSDRTRPKGGRDARSRGSQEVEHRRQEWAKRVNRELDKAGIAARVDHRSHRRREAAGDAPRQLPMPHRGKGLNALWRDHKARCASAARSGAPLPRTPDFIRDFLHREGLNREARRAWLALRAEINDWLDQGSSFDEDGTELLAELAAGARPLIKAASGFHAGMAVPQRPSTPSGAILNVHLLRAFRVGKKPRVR